jgi:hypothetical protein
MGTKMSTKPKNRDRRGRRKGSSRRSDSPRRPDRPSPLCSICGDPIKDITSALARPNDGTPVHFDCALKIAGEELKPREDEKVIYLGKGSFAVVELQAYQQRSLKITRRTDWENLEEKFEWRQKLRADVR